MKTESLERLINAAHHFGLPKTAWEAREELKELVEVEVENHRLAKLVAEAEDANRETTEIAKEQLAAAEKRAEAYRQGFIDLEIFESGTRHDTEGDAFVRHNLRSVLDQVGDLSTEIAQRNKEAELIIELQQRADALLVELRMVYDAIGNAGCGFDHQYKPVEKFSLILPEAAIRAAKEKAK
jgi:hypothetical protein